jgi:hypothetical protein
LSDGGADRAGLEPQTLHQGGGDYFGRRDHAFPLKPDFGFRAADVMAGEFRSVAEPQDVTSSESGRAGNEHNECEELHFTPQLSS